MSAAESLVNFFSATKDECTTEEYIPAMLALYDALNDDDGDIRFHASSAVNALTGQQLVPIEAADHLLQWISRRFCDSAAFRRILVNRLVGESSITIPCTDWKSAGEQLALALRFDDSLFAVEEQNLFVDEIREAKRWISVWKRLEWDIEDPKLHALDEWVIGGLSRVKQLVGEEDGPLGWASRPQVFAICSRVLQCAVMLAHEQANERLRGALADVRIKVQTGKTHVSGYLMQYLDE